jgi:MscS family membrane protein
VDDLQQLWTIPAVRAATILVGSIIVARIAEAVLVRVIGAIATRTSTPLDDVALGVLRRPIFLSLVLIGLGWSITELPQLDDLRPYLFPLLGTLGVLVWMSAAFGVGHAVLDVVSRRALATSIIQPRTLPVIEMVLKIAIVAAAIYFVFLAWDVDLTAWIASAGIIGIAVGFAAKDTLANLFSGIFIVADAPYKVGDFIVLDGGLRGQVTKIGLRSTRMLTDDDVEVTVPNAVIAGGKIVNESGGPSVAQRIGVAVDVAYGSDLDRVRAVLVRCAEGVPHLATDPPPQARFMAFGASGLAFELNVWLADPAERGTVLDVLHTAIYKAFQSARIEIPYPKHDVYLKEGTISRS